MAGDWIKMRKELLTSPKVVRIMSACRADRFRTIGGLFAVWSLFDEQTADGKLDAYTPEILDQIIGFSGLADAMMQVGWLIANEENQLIAVNFDEHNGKTAKRRAAENVRKMSARMSAPDADKLRPKRREEKRRSKKENPLPPKGETDEPNPVGDKPKEEPISFPVEVQDICQAWLEFKWQNGKRYKPRGMKEFVRQVENALKSHGAATVRAAMQQAMANNYQGWTFLLDRQANGKANGKPVTFGQQRQQNTLDLLAKLQADEAAAASGGVAGFIRETSGGGQ